MKLCSDRMSCGQRDGKGAYHSATLPLPYVLGSSQERQRGGKFRHRVIQTSFTVNIGSINPRSQQSRGKRN